MASSTYYIIKRVVDTREDYLYSIMGNGLSFVANYAQAITFEDTATASAFIDFCEANSQDTYIGMSVTLTIEPMS